MKPLIEKLTSNTQHEVKRYTNKAETRLEAFLWNGCTVTLHYPALLQCSETEFVKEFTDAWSSLNRLYLKQYNAKSNKLMQCSN